VFGWNKKREEGQNGLSFDEIQRKNRQVVDEVNQLYTDNIGLHDVPLTLEQWLRYRQSMTYWYITPLAHMEGNTWLLLGEVVKCIDPQTPVWLLKNPRAPMESWCTARLEAALKESQEKR
jgi:hypothetical protein